MLRTRMRVLAWIAAGILSACGGGDSGGNGGTGNQQLASHALGGTVNGASGAVSLQNNGGETLIVATSGTFRFNANVPAGQSYQVTVASQPANQHCVVTGGSGVMGSADINNVVVSCTHDTFTVGGTVSGASGAVVLRNNNGDDLTLTADGGFVFATALQTGNPYSVTVSGHPANQHCSVAAGSGSIQTANVSNVAVTCVSLRRVGGSVAGLTGTVVLQNNGADDLSISANGSFTFATLLLPGAAYQVSVRSQPANRECTVTSSTGTAGGADVTNVAVTCMPSFAVSGTLSGSVGSVVLRNGTDELTTTGNGTFTFSRRLVSGAAYAVTYASSSDPTQRCLVFSGAGTVGSGDVTSVRVSCVSKYDRYKAESYSAFASAHDTSNLEGTWMLLAEGSIVQGLQIAGINPRQAYQLWSRATVRIRRDPGNPAQYFVFTCGPGGARNDSVVQSGQSFSIPFYSASTSNWTRYGVAVVDTTTMSSSSVSQTFGPTGNVSGLLMGWNLSWVLKRISDDPFADPSLVRNNLTSQTVDATCIYESEGTYVATENDGTTMTTVGEGLFFWTQAYASHPLQLHDDINSFEFRFLLRDEIGFFTRYSDADNGLPYLSADGAVINTVRSFSGLASSHATHAVTANGARTADDTLEIP